MTTYQPPPGMMQHPMPGGQPMGALQPPNPGQPMGQPPGQQLPPGMHPMAGPGGPHVSQSGPVMGGMHIAAQGGPNAHAMSHLQPGGPIFQGNPQMANAYAQHAQGGMQPGPVTMAQQQQAQAMLQARNNMGMAMHPNNPMMQQRYPQVQQHPGFRQHANLPAHMQQQQQQQQQMARQMAQMQQNQQQGNQGQIGPLGQPGQPGQPRPQQVMQGGQPEGQGGPSQGQTTPQSQPNSNPTTQAEAQQQQQQQQQQRQIPPQPATPHPPVTQQQTPQRPPTQQGQIPQNQQGQQGLQQPAQLPQGQDQQQQQQPAGQQNVQQQSRDQEQMKLQMRPEFQHGIPNQMLQRQQQLQNQFAGNGLTRLMQFADRLGNFSLRATNPNGRRPSNDIQIWQNLVYEFFSDDATFYVSLHDAAKNQPLLSSQDGQPKRFPIPAPILARYFWTHFDSGVERIQIFLGNANFPNQISNGMQYIESPKTNIIYWYLNGTQVVSTGVLKALLLPNNKIDMLEFRTLRHDEYIPRAAITPLFGREPDFPNLDSPKMTKKGNNKQQQDMERKLLDYEQKKSSRTMKFGDLPARPIREDGVNHPVFNFYELAETFTYMRDLFEFSQENPAVRPSDVVDRVIESTHASTNQINQQQGHQQFMNQPNLQTLNMHPQNPNSFQQPPPGMRTPGLNGPMAAGQHPPNQFASPAHSHLSLPMANSSPHMRGSPQNPHMQAPGVPMVPQHSQQGTNSTAASSNNASPNVSNKRRRSTVKTEAQDDGAGDVSSAGAKKAANATKRQKN